MSTIEAPAEQGTCFACGRRLINNGWPDRPDRMADTRDGQIVAVGFDCWRKINSAGDAGYQPPKGGPRLYLSQ